MVAAKALGVLGLGFRVWISEQYGSRMVYNRTFSLSGFWVQGLGRHW